jgi:nicotinamide mononucleotide adenylyltransferase
MAKIGLVAGSYKPYHRGHHAAVLKAASECDRVILFVSLASRERPGEVAISGDDMRIVWENYLEPVMPENVEVRYVSVPIKDVWDVLGKANDAGSKDTFVVYADEEDLRTRFPEKSLNKYCETLYRNGQVILSATERLFSGTKMRQFIASGDKANFKKNLPRGVDGDAVWSTLTHTQAEALLRSYLRLLITDPKAS